MTEFKKGDMVEFYFESPGRKAWRVGRIKGFARISGMPFVKIDGREKSSSEYTILVDNIVFIRRRKWWEFWL